ncbi:TPA: D-aminoacylase [Clostridioides difficile]|nr:D-aminoacylase [Clostridioides difficile]
MRTLIKHGLIVDGNKTPAYEGDILIENEKILKISQDLNEEADKVIDAKGRVICPGFIDTHSHSDLVILVNPYNEVKIRQGITTEVLGQDGISMAPLPQEHISSWRKNLAGLDGESDEIDWKYETTENYLKMMDYNGVGLNETYLVPHGNVRMEAMGLEDRPATKEEIQKMCEITERELKAGAIGLSTGLIYIPCAYSLTEEIIEMCKVVAKYDGVFVVHQRSEADTILTSMEEIIEIGKMRGKDPLDATFDLLKEEENAVGMVDFYGLEEHIIGFMKRDEQNVCTDGLLAGKPHPRAYGSFPKILGRYVRELNVLTIEEAVYKMTKKAARSFSIKDRGELKEGYFADIVIFDKDTVSGCDDFINSMQYPTGIDYVIINGNCVVEEGKYNKIKAGKVLKN